MRRVRSPFAILAITFVVLGTACSGRRAGPPADGATGPVEDAVIAKVIDGDTISVERGGRDLTIRLIGIDTPETKRPNTPVECFGPEAHDHLATLLPPGTEVRLEHDVEPKDKYDRELAYVHRAADGLFVNLVMVRDGYAGVLVFAPNTRHEPAFADAVDNARLTRRGLWGACGAPHRVAD